jgi:hypothetical protein
MLYASDDSDDEHGVATSAASGPVSSRASSSAAEVVNVELLVKRQCRCTRRTCFSQFADRAPEVIKAREKFNSMDSNDKALG